MADYKITETEKAAHHLRALADRPNAMTSYKQGKLSANGMKKLFDDNLDFLAEKHNKLGEALEAEHDDRVAKHEELVMKHEELAAEHDALEAKHNELEKSHEKTAAQVETLISEPIDRMYPVGAVYISFGAASPATLFGGSWQALESGNFLMASTGASGVTKGSSTHTHSAAGMYADVRISNDAFGKTIITWADAGITLNDNYVTWGLYPDEDKLKFEPADYANADNAYSRGIAVGGDTTAAETIPPCITVHMWRRIA